MKLLINMTGNEVTISSNFLDLHIMLGFHKLGNESVNLVRNGITLNMIKQNKYVN